MRLGRAAAAAAALLCWMSAAAAEAPATGPDSNLPVPRFVSLKTPGANGRHGPGFDHRVDWVYERVGLPLQVTAESGPWRRVVDPDGAAVWMHSQNLDPRRTVYVTRAARMRRQPRAGAGALADLAPGVVAVLTGCEGSWRRVAVAGRVGWVEADLLWAADCAGL